MNISEIVYPVLREFAGMSAEEFNLSEGSWTEMKFDKGSYYNEHRNICRYLGFIVNGVFRSYTIDETSGEEKNVFLYSSHGFVVSFKSFVQQIPCDYHTQALTDSTVICIDIVSLQALYRKSHEWEKFGRLLAQEAFNITMSRIESYLFKSPEQRYLDLMQQHPDIINNVPLYHISSYLGIQGPSLSRIRRRISGK